MGKTKMHRMIKQREGLQASALEGISVSPRKFLSCYELAVALFKIILLNEESFCFQLLTQIFFIYKTINSLWKIHKIQKCIMQLEKLVVTLPSEGIGIFQCICSQVFLSKISIFHTIVCKVFFTENVVSISPHTL